MKDDQTPASKADVLRLEKSMKSNFGRMNDSIDQVLTVLVNVEKRLTKSVDDHEWRIRRLESRVGVTAA